MRAHYDLPFTTIAVPSGVSPAVFIPADNYRSIPNGAQWARAQGELAHMINSLEAQPAIQFNTSEDGSAVTTALGTNQTSYGLHHPTAATDISSYAGQYQVWRPGWLVKNAGGATAYAWVGGFIEVWGGT